MNLFRLSSCALETYPERKCDRIPQGQATRSAFATVRLRQRVTKGSGSRIKALTMAFKLVDMAEKRWRRISAPHLVKGILSNAVYENGVKVDAA